MVSTLLDEVALGALLAIGGEGLRAQLLDDLRGCEDELSELCEDTSIRQPETQKRLRKALHKLRGLALTIGAGPLAAACAETEATTMAPSTATTVSQTLQIRADCQNLRTRIQQFPQACA